MNYLGFSFYIEKDKDIPGGPVVKTSSRVHRFDPRSENLDPACLPVWQKKLKKRRLEKVQPQRRPVLRQRAGLGLKSPADC